MSRGTVLITGASSGIGEALARKFADEGFDLIISARREDRLQQLADDLMVQVDVVTSDLGVAGGAESLIAKVSELGRVVDVLVNNAGIGHTGPFAEMSVEEVDATLILNMQSLTVLTRHYAGEMASRNLGRILNVASVAAFQPVPGMSLYAASKAFVLSLTEGLSEELRADGVHITALCPGLTRTEMLDHLPTGNLPPIAMSSAEDVAREGYDAVMGREVIRIPGLVNQAAVAWAQYQPRWVVRGLGGLIGRMTLNR